MSEFKVTTNIDEVMDWLAKKPEELNDNIKKGFVKSSSIMMNAAIQSAPKSTGALAQSIKRKIRAKSAIVFPASPYAAAVEEGTKPHAIPIKEIQPGGSLHRWATKKGIPPGAVWTSIKKKGTKAQPFMEDAFQNNLEKATQVFFQEIL